MFRRSFALLSVLMLVSACDRAPVAAHRVQPTATVAARVPTDAPSPEAPPTPATSAPTDQPTPAPDQDTPSGAPPSAPLPPAACAASATGSITIGAENVITGVTVLTAAVSAGCPVSVLFAGNDGTLRFATQCVPGVPCQIYANDQPPASFRNTGVTYTLTVTDASGQSRTVATATSKPFNYPTPPPTLPPSPSPHA